MKLKDCHHNEVFRWVLIDEIFFPKMLYTKKIEAYHKKEVLRHLEYHRKINISGIFLYITVKNKFLDFHWLVYIRKFFHYTLFNQIFLFPMVVCLQCFSTKKRFMCCFPLQCWCSDNGEDCDNVPFLETKLAWNYWIPFLYAFIILDIVFIGVLFGILFIFFIPLILVVTR